MVELDLKLASLKHLLFRIDLYEKLIFDKGYKKFCTRNYRNRFKSLRNSIESEISQIQESLETAGVESPKEDFSFGEVRSCLENETDIEGFVTELNRISIEIFRENQGILINTINNVDFPPEWISPTSTFSPISDTATIKLFVESDYSNVDDLFINLLMNNHRVKQTFIFWKTQPKISNRIPIIEEAIEAHIEKRFYLSVSALIPQIEGLMRDSLKSMNRSVDFGSMRKEDMKRATSALKDLWKSQDHNLPEASSLLDSLPDAVSDLYDEFNPTQFVQGKLYRHGICHGLQTDFGSEKNSLRLILLLDRIIFFYTIP
jgi:hypothetical protein